ncbi:hypothetical protein LOK49_LG08G01653 [Camellia lanceoleosa]|uniref:Uncharacterized protein n=1 Tax=Camellia lanceoleosa TaxID=1840588 RepID=A0ACC0GQK6_9ERIC|nr:hypothetical protein LOK49_LG08G01653 [Camellia lanceoleosa]
MELLNIVANCVRYAFLEQAWVNKITGREAESVDIGVVISERQYLIDEAFETRHSDLI